MLSTDERSLWSLPSYGQFYKSRHNTVVSYYVDETSESAWKN